MAVVNLLIPAYQYPTTGALWADLTAAPARYAVANISTAGRAPRRRSAITRRSSARPRRPG